MTISTHWQPFVQRLQRTQSAKGRKQEQCFSAEGHRLLERALNNQAPIESCLFSERSIQNPSPREHRLLERLQAQSIPVYVAPNAILQEQNQGRTFGSVFTLIRQLPPSPLVNLLPPTDAPCKVLVLANIMDPGNIGALVRTGLASGVHAVLCIQGTEPHHPKAVRTSMGSLFAIPVLHYTDPLQTLKLLQTLQIQCIGAIVQHGIPPYEGEVHNRYALFVGSEAHGVPLEIRSQLDLRWRIPMPPNTSSFSVNAATSILLYEANRRQWNVANKETIPANEMQNEESAKSTERRKKP